MPLFALSLKQYLSGVDLRVKTCDSEDATAALGDSEMLSVEHAPADRDVSAGCLTGVLGRLFVSPAQQMTLIRPFIPWRNQ